MTVLFIIMTAVCLHMTILYIFALQEIRAVRRNYEKACRERDSARAVARKVIEYDREGE